MGSNNDGICENKNEYVQMKKMKLLTALVLLTAAFVTSVFLPRETKGHMF